LHKPFTECIAKALAKELFFLLLPYKRFVLSITSDNGTEFYEHKLIAKNRTPTFSSHILIRRGKEV
jgi:IS30 family transposase